MTSRRRDALGLACALVAALAAHRFVLDLELMGWDTYPTIAASRIESAADLLGSFGEELMDGRYPHGSFYRPLTNLVFAWDHALWGVRPLGYQLTNLLILLAGVAAVFFLARRWLGPGWGPAVAALAVAVHPLQLENVPLAARRADMLASLWVVCALAARRPAAVALFVVLAVASKETGAVALPVVAAAAWWMPRHGSAAERSRRALRRCALPAAAFAGFLALRTAVLGGLGGHPGSSLVAGVGRGLARATEHLRLLVLPQPWTGLPVADTAIYALLAAGLVAAAALAATDRSGARAARVPALAGVWLLCLVLLTGASGERASWYGSPFLPPYALLLGAIADRAGAEWRRQRRAPALASVLLVATLLASHLAFSGLARSYPEWETLSRQERAFLDRVRRAVAEAPAGSTVRVAGLPLGTGTPLEQVGIRSALCLADYSVEAWAALVLPERRVRVVLHTGGEPTPPTPGAVTIDAVPLPSPVLGSVAGAPG